MSYFDTFKDKSDEDLIKIKNQCSPTSEDHQQADIELHKRQKAREDRDYSVQLSTKKMTLVILIITVLSFVTIVYQCEKPLSLPMHTSKAITNPNNSPDTKDINQKK